MTKTKIPYLDVVWNITHGCTKISEGCQQCWAEKMSHRLAGMNVKGYEKKHSFEPTFCPWKLDEPLKLQKPSVIGVSFMGDLFHKNITLEQRLQILDVMRCSKHTFVICTKRPDNMVETMRNALAEYDARFFHNVWFGCSIENNKTLHERLPIMNTITLDYKLNTWLSIEPLLEDISQAMFIHNTHNIPIIVGGESGTGARYCDPFWIQYLWQEIPKEKFYFKQWGTNKQNMMCDGIDYLGIEKTKNLPWKK